MHRIRKLTLVTGAAILVAAAGLGQYTPQDADGKRLPTRVRFAMDFSGTVTGSWHDSQPVDLRQCAGHDFSGTFSSSVRPGRRFTVLLEKVFGRLQANWVGVGTYSVPDTGVVTSNRTAQGWMMVLSGGCKQREQEWIRENCGARTFAGQVGLAAVGATRPPDVRYRRAFLQWQLEPPGAEVGCMDGIQYAPPGIELGEDAAANLDVRKLYSCGIRQPRRCRMTIRGSSDYPYHATYRTVYGATVTLDSTRHFEWSATFKAVGTR